MARMVRKVNDLISIQMAIEHWGRSSGNLTNDQIAELQREIESLPSAEPKTGRDCTDFVRWLMDEVMDEENWQMNAVANGEIICRKLKKLGLLDVVDGYYVETQKTGKWIKATGMMPPEFHGHHCCSECGNFANMEPPFGNREDLSKFCPNCGSKMMTKGGESE